MADPSARSIIHSFGHLPIEVLSMIFAPFAFTPRLRVLSLVCKRWRTAASRITRHFDVKTPAHVQALTSFLTNVTSLKIAPRVELPIAIPSTIRMLDLRDIYWSTESCLDVIAVPNPCSITSLGVPSCNLVPLSARTLLQCLRLQLRNLRVRNFYYDYSVIDDILKQPFPALDSIDVSRIADGSGPYFTDPWATFMCRHAGQLTRLVYFSDDSEGVHSLEMVQFPKLRHMELGGNAISTAIISNCPSLAYVSLHHLRVSDLLRPAFPLTKLCSISAFIELIDVDEDEIVDLLGVMKRCPQISFDLGRFSAFLTLLPHVTSLSLTQTTAHDWLDAGASILHITALSIFEFDSKFRAQAFPCLRKLRVHMELESALLEECLACLRRFISLTPRLTSLCLDLWDLSHETGLPSLRSFFLEMEQRGLEEIEIGDIQSFTTAEFEYLDQGLNWLHLELAREYLAIE